MAYTYTNRAGAVLAARVFTASEQDALENAGSNHSREPDPGNLNLVVTLADGREVSRTNVPEGDGPETFHVVTAGRIVGANVARFAAPANDDQNPEPPRAEPTPKARSARAGRRR